MLPRHTMQPQPVMQQQQQIQPKDEEQAALQMSDA
jgi:hypothetical protein